MADDAWWRQTWLRDFVLIFLGMAALTVLAAVHPQWLSNKFHEQLVLLLTAGSPFIFGVMNSYPMDEAYPLHWPRWGKVPLLIGLVLVELVGLIGVMAATYQVLGGLADQG